MAEVTITIPDNQIERLATAMKDLYPIPQIENPAYVDAETTPEEPEMIPEYTDGQWGKICILNFLKNNVKRYEEKEAKKAVVTPSVDDLAS